MGQMLLIVKEAIKDKKWVIILLGGLVGLFGLMITSMVETLDLEELSQVFDFLPEEILESPLLGGGGIEALTNPYGFLNVEVLGFIWIYAGIYLLFASSSLLAGEVEKQTIELSLSKPITRTKYLGSKIISLYLVITVMMVFAFLILSGAIASSQTFIDEGLYWDRLWGTCIVVVLFLSALSMITLFASTIFLNSKKAVLVGIIALFVMFFINGFYIYLEEIEDWKYFTVFFYYNPMEYLVNADVDLFVKDIIVLSSINAALVVGSLIMFNVKDIPN